MDGKSLQRGRILGKLSLVVVKQTWSNIRRTPKTFTTEDTHRPSGQVLLPSYHGAGFSESADLAWSIPTPFYSIDYRSLCLSEWHHDSSCKNMYLIRLRNDTTLICLPPPTHNSFPLYHMISCCIAQGRPPVCPPLGHRRRCFVNTLEASGAIQCPVGATRKL